MKPHRLIYCQSVLCQRKHKCDLFTGHLYRAVQAGKVDLELGEKLVIEHFLPTFGECTKFEARVPYDAEKERKV